MKRLIKILSLLVCLIMFFNSCKKDDENLIIKTIEVFYGNSPDDWTDLDLSEAIGINFAMVTLKVSNLSSDSGLVALFRQNGDVSDYTIGSDTDNMVSIGNNGTGQAIIYTDADGLIEWKANNTVTTKIEVVAYIK